MLITGVRDFSIHGAKKTASPIGADGSCGNHNLRRSCIVVVLHGED